MLLYRELYREPSTRIGAKAMRMVPRAWAGCTRVISGFVEVCAGYGSLISRGGGGGERREMLCGRNGGEQEGGSEEEEGVVRNGCGM